MQLGPSHEGTFNGSPVMEPELLLQELRSGRNVVVVDVRNHDEFCEGHIEGARSIPIHQLVARASEISSDGSVLVVVVSNEADRAKIAGASLRLAGYAEIATLAGGIKRWRELGYPLKRTSLEMRAVTPIPPSVRGAR